MTELIWLWSDRIQEVIKNFLHSFRLSWEPNKWPVLESIPCAAERNVYFVVSEIVCKCLLVYLVYSVSCSLTLFNSFFAFIIYLWQYGNTLLSPTVTMLICDFKSSSVCFTILGAYVFSACMFRMALLRECWFDLYEVSLFHLICIDWIYENKESIWLE